MSPACDAARGGRRLHVERVLGARHLPDGVPLVAHARAQHSPSQPLLNLTLGGRQAGKPPGASVPLCDMAAAESEESWLQGPRRRIAAVSCGGVLLQMRMGVVPSHVAHIRAVDVLHWRALCAKGKLFTRGSAVEHAGGWQNNSAAIIHMHCRQP